MCNECNDYLLVPTSFLGLFNPDDGFHSICFLIRNFALDANFSTKTSWGEMGWAPAGGYFIGGECGQGGSVALCVSLTELFKPKSDGLQPKSTNISDLNQKAFGTPSSTSRWAKSSAAQKTGEQCVGAEEWRICHQGSSVSWLAWSRFSSDS